VAVKVVLEPTVTEDAAVSVVEVESRPTVSRAPGLVEPLRIDPEVGLNTARSCAVDAANDVEQATVALRPLGTAGMLAQPGIAPAPFSNVTVPHRAVLLVPAVTVAINVTLWLVTGALGVASSPVVVGWEAAGICATVTTPNGPLGLEALPPGPVAVTTQRIVLPTSATESA
jgi:hypothetical protein